MKHELRRPTRALSPEDTRGVLDRAPFMTLAMTGADGWPYAVNLSFARVGETLYFHSAQEGFKVDSLHRDSRVCATAVEYNEAKSATLSVRYRSAVAFGAVELVTDPGERARGLLAICRKYASDNETIEKASAHCVAAKVYAVRIREMTGKFNLGE